MPEILLATHNAGKVREIRRVAERRDWRWHGLDDFPDVPEAVEDADTFLENARKKAEFAIPTSFAAMTGSRPMHAAMSENDGSPEEVKRRRSAAT